MNVDIFINELTPLVKGFITLGCSSPVLCQEELLQLMKGWKDPSGTASEHLGLPIERLTSGCLKNASLAVDDLAGQLLL